MPFTPPVHQLHPWSASTSPLQSISFTPGVHQLHPWSPSASPLESISFTPGVHQLHPWSPSALPLESINFTAGVHQLHPCSASTPPLESINFTPGVHQLHLCSPYQFGVQSIPVGGGVHTSWGYSPCPFRGSRVQVARDKGGIPAVFPQSSGRGALMVNIPARWGQNADANPTSMAEKRISSVKSRGMTGKSSRHREASHRGFFGSRLRKELPVPINRTSTALSIPHHYWSGLWCRPPTITGLG